MNIKQHLIVAATLLALSGVTSVASAASNGLYAGGSLGYGDIDNSAGHLIPFTSDAWVDGMAGRLFAGYQFNKYLALEGGYSFQENGFLKATTQNSGDLEAKGMWPITERFNIFGKLGGAYVSQDQQGGGTSDGVRPLYGVGLGYDLTPKMSTTLDLTRILGSGSIHDSNFAMLGLAYHL